MALNSKFSVRKFVVGLKEKIMHASYGETSGFTPVANDELNMVNGGGVFTILALAAVTVGLFYLCKETNKKSSK